MTAVGSWNAPTRFLPSRVLMPVLPPTAASTIASRVVGTWTTGTPRSQLAAREAAEVGDGANAHGHDRVGAGEAVAAELAPEVERTVAVLCLGVGTV